MDAEKLEKVRKALEGAARLMPRFTAGQEIAHREILDALTLLEPEPEEGPRWRVADHASGKQWVTTDVPGQDRSTLTCIAIADILAALRPFFAEVGRSAQASGNEEAADFLAFLDRVGCGDG